MTHTIPSWACPKCGRPVLRCVFDSLANYGKGITVVWHGEGKPIGKTGLVHADTCNLDGDRTKELGKP
jgi:hypothetical protein